MRISSFFVLVALASCGGNLPAVGGTDDMMAGPEDMSAVCGGGPAMGAADVHCMGDGGILAVSVEAAQCTASGGATTPAYGATMYGTSGYDDGCKYLVSYKVSTVCEHRDIGFTLLVKNAADGSPVTGANPTAELTLDGTHKPPSLGESTTELGDGVYGLGPYEFDGNGTWVVRFHLFNECVDLPASPRGQAAFFIDVK